MFGLVLEGGASRAYYSVGAMDALMDNNIWADYLIGASAGIANGISYMSRQRGRSLAIGTKYLSDKRYMGIKHLLSPKNKSLYNISFVFSDIPNIYLPFDYETYKKYSKNVFAAVTNLKTGKCEYINVTGEDKDWKEITASCALPLLFPPIQISEKLYMDGGITDPIPVEKALSDGCNKVLTIITREKAYIKEEESGLKIAARKYKKYPNFAHALDNRTECYNNSHKKLLDLEKEGKAFVLAPENSSGWRRTESDPEKIREIYNAGYKDLIKNLDKIKEYLNK